MTLQPTIRPRRFYEMYGFQETGAYTEEATGLPALRLRLDQPTTKNNRRETDDG